MRNFGQEIRPNQDFSTDDMFLFKTMVQQLWKKSATGSSGNCTHIWTTKAYGYQNAVRAIQSLANIRVCKRRYCHYPLGSIITFTQAEYFQVKITLKQECGKILRIKTKIFSTKKKIHCYKNLQQ
jgi:hypothetical protein